MMFGPRKSKGARLRGNRYRGKLTEDAVRQEYGLRGYHMERTGRGHDFKATRRDFLTGRVIETKYIEVKSNGGRLSKLQKRTRKKTPNYVVERRRMPFF